MAAPSSGLFWARALFRSRVRSGRAGHCCVDESQGVHFQPALTQLQQTRRQLSPNSEIARSRGSCFLLALQSTTDRITRSRQLVGRLEFVLAGKQCLQEGAEYESALRGESRQIHGTCDVSSVSARGGEPIQQAGAAWRARIRLPRSHHRKQVSAICAVHQAVRRSRCRPGSAER